MNWKEENNRLVKEFQLTDFKTITDRLNEISEIADKLNHHPDFSVYDYRNIRFELFTHDSSAITQKDYDLAAEIDRIFEI